MEIRVSISERLVFVLLILTALVSAIGITMAQSPDPGHAWNEIACAGCVTETNLADGSVTPAKIASGAVDDSKIISLSWDKLDDVPSDLSDGDQVGLTSESDPTVPAWAKGGSCPCGTCWYVRTTTSGTNNYREMCTPSGWRQTSNTWTSGGGHCFVGETRISMADGSYKNIEDVQVGECVKGKSSDNNVIEIRSHPVGSGVIFSINRRVMFTGDHPFLGVDGNWKVLNPDAYEAVPEKTISNVEKLRINDVLITETGQQKVMRIDVVDRDSEDMVYDLVVDGDMTYIADGFVVHTE